MTRSEYTANRQMADSAVRADSGWCEPSRCVRARLTRFQRVLRVLGVM
jgi:hypothetical protein